MTAGVVTSQSCVTLFFAIRAWISPCSAPTIAIGARCSEGTWLCGVVSDILRTILEGRTRVVDGVAKPQTRLDDRMIDAGYTNEEVEVEVKLEIVVID